MAPVKLFDNGTATYFKFRSSDTTPVVSVVDANGGETKIAVHRKGEYWVVEVVAARFNVQVGGQTVHVFNEKLYHS